MRIRSLELNAFCLARILLGILPITNLVLSPIHVQALLKLENEICGFVMFMSVLVGLMVLFESFRMLDENEGMKHRLVCLLAIACDIGILYYLASIYGNALAHQVPLNEPESVKKALILTISLIGSYVVAASLLVASLIKDLRS